jgi:hypothetical protein
MQKVELAAAQHLIKPASQCKNSFITTYSGVLILFTALPVSEEPKKLLNHGTRIKKRKSEFCDEA